VCRQLLDATELESVGAFELKDVHMRGRWAAGRVLLLGDAAHAMCNRLGSGGCTGMEDAYVAAECIALCLQARVGSGGSASGGGGGVAPEETSGAARHAAVQHAFRLTERRRIHRARRVQFESYMLAQLTVVFASWRVVRALRDAGLRWLGRRSERWRVPVYDFLNNYRSSSEARLQQ
jgi:2-polyprenyl-6-methoxyphenol hydroxylase-like FAD-dependent oxidoreductase